MTALQMRTCRKKRMCNFVWPHSSMSFKGHFFHYWVQVVTPDLIFFFFSFLHTHYFLSTCCVFPFYTPNTRVTWSWQPKMAKSTKNNSPEIATTKSTSGWKSLETRTKFSISRNYFQLWSIWNAHTDRFQNKFYKSSKSAYRQASKK